MKKVVIVIPIYKSQLSAQETLSLLQVFKVLGKYDIIAVCPESIDTADLSAKFPDLVFDFFEDKWFQGIKAYNALVLSEEFYLRFCRYEYMLIYQLDAFVFSDKLQEWLQKDYDYVGAPWIPVIDKYLKASGKAKLAVFRLFHKCNGRDTRESHLYGVGNGGFSLRKIRKFIELTRHYKDKIDSDLSAEEKIYPEDLWLFYEPDGKFRLKKPGWKKALEFSFEQNPEASYRINKNRLPFGCHAWYHPDYKDFWKNIIK